MGYVRFVINDRDRDSGRRQGVFQALGELDDRKALTPGEQLTCDETYQWFRKNLRRPRRFTRSSKPHAKKVAVSWFKDTASRHVEKMRILAGILEAHGIHVQMIRTERPGYVVYEDDHQVTAEPFGETGA